MNKYNYIFGALSLLAVGLASCNNDESYDFPGDAYNRVYMQDNSKSFKIVQTPISSISNLDFSIPVKCTQKASETIKATVEVDNSMIAEYNEKNGTNYEALPSNALVIEHATMTIPAGGMASTDTLHITATDNAEVLASLKSENGYLIPLRISETEGGNALPSTNVYTTYLTMTVTEDNVNHEATEDDIKGTLVTERTDWSATTDGTVYSWYAPLEELFDGDASNYSYIRNSEINLDINMGKPYTFDAITLYYLNWRGNKNGSFSNGTTIYTSNDGTTWKSAGVVESSSSICVFYAPLTAQYVRIHANNYMYVGDFNIYVTK